ncbi:BRCA1 domain-containing protein [Cryptosporidium ubiquitum]|uniref:BRCA1 domain-containing protein n=1 Tax=Cryptosporidium ubiquitum TaxID=857276 RepID=A0A1J4MFH0_9CRYT|nr:BRCA1 domain-containing protein [Cryptosporidium ubiquitum]OII72976.1 BRCA1 domain-containing protein [Cryptosporidium ubiquitum]
MYIRNETEEDLKNGEEIDEVGCLLIFDETYKSVIDSFPLNEGRNYICGSTKSVFEPFGEKTKKRVKNTKLKGNHKTDNEDYHAIIHVEQGEFFVEDNNSDVGTFRKNLKHKIKPNCKYELIPGEDLYFGNLKTKLIRYDSMESIETPKWKRHSIENKENDQIQLEILEESPKIDQIENIDFIRNKKSPKNESISTFNEDIENDSLLSNRPKRKSPKSIQDKNINHLSVQNETDKVVLLWTGCTPTNKDIELIRRANLTSIDSEDLEFMSDKVTHVVSSSIKRTLKFLWAISKGLPIISPITLRQILNLYRNKELNFKEFNNLCMNQLLNDLEGEKKFGFSLKNSINKAQNNMPIFSNYKFVISPNIKVPSINEISWLLKSSNAEIIELEKANKIQNKSNIIFIGTNSDPNKLFKNFKTHSIDFIFDSIIKQEINTSKNLITI